MANALKGKLSQLGLLFYPMKMLLKNLWRVRVGILNSCNQKAFRMDR